MSDLLSKDKQFVWHPFTQMQTAKTPLEIVEAKDTWLIAADGRRYLDINSSWWVNVHGHGNSYIGNAISEQFSKLDHVIFAGATHPKAVELSERIIGILPSKFEKVFFSDDGSTAVEVALKMAFQYYYNKGESRKRVLALDGAYHGDTFGAMSIGQRGYFNEPFEHFFFDVDFLPFPTIENESTILESAKSYFESNEFACVIVEPLVQGSAGMRMYRPEFLDQLIALAQVNNVKVIFDEIMTGWGRTGRLFAMDHCLNKPDIVCLSKGLTGGVLPLGLTVATNEIYDAFLSEETTKALLHGHSFTGNALACAAACASLDLFEKQSTKDNIQQLVQWNTEFAKELASYTTIHDVRQCGTILAIELNTGEGNSYFSNIRDKAYDFFLENGILLRPLGNVLFINPPYCIKKEEHELFRKMMKDFLNVISN